MIRTACIKIVPTQEQAQALRAVRDAYANACNLAVNVAQKEKAFSRYTLHHAAYRTMRALQPLGAQLTCRAIRAASDAYKILRSQGGKLSKVIRFSAGSVPYDVRTMRTKNGAVSLYTLSGRVKIPLVLGEQQRCMLAQGVLREGRLISRRGKWFLHLAIDFESAPARTGSTMGVDVGENNLATTSTGKIFSGKRLCFERDKRLALRKRLQANGTQSSKQLLRKVSGQEKRRVRHVNHSISKGIVEEALKTGAGCIALEDLTHIRRRIKAGKRVRTRLHRWPWRQLQDFVAYKAQQWGVAVVYVDPAYTSQTCSVCLAIGQRRRHLFSCSCGSRRHADANAASNLRRLAGVITPVTGAVTTRNVAQREVKALRVSRP